MCICLDLPLCYTFLLLSWVSSPCWCELRCPAEFRWNTSVRWKRSSPPRRCSIPHSKHSALRMVRTRFAARIWTFPSSPLFFPSSFSFLKLFSPLRGILAGVHPADQWQNIWLRFCRQCHRCRAKHWAISPWQQGKWRRNKLSFGPKSFNQASTASLHLMVSVWCLMLCNAINMRTSYYLICLFFLSCPVDMLPQLFRAKDMCKSVGNLLLLSSCAGQG